MHTRIAASLFLKKAVKSRFGGALILALARNSVLLLDQHRLQFLFRHPHNQIGLVAQITAVSARIPG
jgi:hypothetical protein